MITKEEHSRGEVVASNFDDACRSAVTIYSHFKDTLPKAITLEDIKAVVFPKARSLTQDQNRDLDNIYYGILAIKYLSDDFRQVLDELRRENYSNLWNRLKYALQNFLLNTAEYKVEADSYRNWGFFFFSYHAQEGGLITEELKTKLLELIHLFEIPQNDNLFRDAGVYVSEPTDHNHFLYNYLFLSVFADLCNTDVNLTVDKSALVALIDFSIHTLIKDPNVKSYVPYFDFIFSILTHPDLDEANKIDIIHTILEKWNEKESRREDEGRQLRVAIEGKAGGKTLILGVIGLFFTVLTERANARDILPVLGKIQQAFNHYFDEENVEIEENSHVNLYVLILTFRISRLITQLDGEEKKQAEKALWALLRYCCKESEHKDVDADKLFLSIQDNKGSLPESLLQAFKSYLFSEASLQNLKSYLDDENKVVAGSVLFRLYCLVTRKNDIEEFVLELSEYCVLYSDEEDEKKVAGFARMLVSIYEDIAAYDSGSTINNFILALASQYIKHGNEEKVNNFAALLIGIYKGMLITDGREIAPEKGLLNELLKLGEFYSPQAPEFLMTCLLFQTIFLRLIKMVGQEYSNFYRTLSFYFESKRNCIENESDLYSIAQTELSHFEFIFLVLTNEELTAEVKVGILNVIWERWYQKDHEKEKEAVALINFRELKLQEEKRALKSVEKFFLFLSFLSDNGIMVDARLSFIKINQYLDKGFNEPFAVEKDSDFKWQLLALIFKLIFTLMHPETVSDERDAALKAVLRYYYVLSDTPEKDRIENLKTNYRELLSKQFVSLFVRFFIGQENVSLNKWVSFCYAAANSISQNLMLEDRDKINEFTIKVVNYYVINGSDEKSQEFADLLIGLYKKIPESQRNKQSVELLLLDNLLEAPNFKAGWPRAQLLFEAIVIRYANISGGIANALPGFRKSLGNLQIPSRPNRAPRQEEGVLNVEGNGEDEGKKAKEAKAENKKLNTFEKFFRKYLWRESTLYRVLHWIKNNPVKVVIIAGVTLAVMAIALTPVLPLSPLGVTLGAFGVKLALTGVGAGAANCAFVGGVGVLVTAALGFTINTLREIGYGIKNFVNKLRQPKTKLIVKDRAKKHSGSHADVKNRLEVILGRSNVPNATKPTSLAERTQTPREPQRRRNDRFSLLCCFYRSRRATPVPGDALPATRQSSPGSNYSM